MGSKGRFPVQLRWGGAITATLVVFVIAVASVSAFASKNGPSDKKLEKPVASAADPGDRGRP